MSSRSDRTTSTSSGGSYSTPHSSIFTRRTPSIPGPAGDKALYTVSTQPPGNRAPSLETRILDLRTGTSSTFSNEAGNREVKWLGIADDVVWLRDAGDGSTEVWIADASGRTQECHCAGRIAARASHLRIKRLQNEYGDIAIAVGCPTNGNGNLYNPVMDNGTTPPDEIRNAIFFTTLRKKATDDEGRHFSYIISPSRWINALRGTGLESPLPAPHGSLNDFDVSFTGICFLSQDNTSNSANFPAINAYYIPLKTFTELSKPRPQIVQVRDHDGRSLLPVFSPNGSAVAFLKKKHPIDRNDRNRLIVINNIRDYRANMPSEALPTRVSNKEWHLSPFSIAWADSGKELYAVAVDQGIRKLFKIPAALSTIDKDPEPITNESKTPADLRHLRMVFSAPMETNRP